MTLQHISHQPCLLHCGQSCCSSGVTGAEDQVSVNQQVERSKMERDYQAQMATLSEELNRVRQELTSRTEVMGQEMERWRQTAEATSRWHAVPLLHCLPSCDHLSFQLVFRMQDFSLLSKDCLGYCNQLLLTCRIPSQNIDACRTPGLTAAYSLPDSQTF